MSTKNIEVVSRTQNIRVDPQDNSVAIVNAGPPGPPGAAGGAAATTTVLDADAHYAGTNVEDVLAEVATNINSHTQATQTHTNATSGRDFVALFQNGLV